MRVTQTISIGSLRINSMSNTSILQIGTSGSMKSRSESINEYIPQAEANQKIEGKIDKELKKEMTKEGLPVEPPRPPGPQTGTQPGTQQGAQAGAQNGASVPIYPYAPKPAEGPDAKVERKNRT
jgi:spore germination protein PB